MKPGKGVRVIEKERVREGENFESKEVIENEEN
jgi:hypothetical protein